MQLENSMLMYGVYNVDTLETLSDTVHQILNITSSHERCNIMSSHERLFMGQQSSLTLRSLDTNALGLQHYSINSLLYYKDSTVQIHCFI